MNKDFLCEQFCNHSVIMILLCPFLLLLHVILLWNVTMWKGNLNWIAHTCCTFTKRAKCCLLVQLIMFLRLSVLFILGKIEKESHIDLFQKWERIGRLNLRNRYQITLYCIEIVFVSWKKLRCLRNNVD